MGLEVIGEVVTNGFETLILHKSFLRSSDTILPPNKYKSLVVLSTNPGHACLDPGVVAELLTP